MKIWIEVDVEAKESRTATILADICDYLIDINEVMGVEAVMEDSDEHNEEHSITD